MTQLPSMLYSDIEDDLRSAVRGFLADKAPVAEVLERADQEAPFGKGARQAWSGLAEELGLAALPVSAEDGGGGATWREAAVVLEELGRAVTDVPYFTSAVLATALAQSAGARAIVSLLAAGGAVGAVVAPFAAPLSPVSALAWDGSTLTGRVAGVAGAAEATQLLVPVTGALLLVPADAARVRPLVSFDMTRRIADVEFSAASATVLAEGTAADAAITRTADLGAALLGSEQLGVAERALEMTVGYLKQRRQFGRVLGSYQALKHRLADVWTGIAQARAVARYAAACAAAPDLPVAASLAQAVCGPVAVQAVEECVQLHGGIGFTWEYPAHLYLKRARADALALGTASWHRRRLAALTGLAEAAGQPICPAQKG